MPAPPHQPTNPTITNQSSPHFAGALGDEASATSMALTYCDMTTGATGEPVTLGERLADIERRYGAGHVVTRSVHQARPELERYIRHVQASLRSL